MAEGTGLRFLNHPDVRAFLRGAAIPGILTTVFIFGGVIYALFLAPIPTTIPEAVKIAIFAALFVSFIGVGEIVGTILGGGGFKRRAWFMALGYVFIWLSCISIAMHLT